MPEKGSTPYLSIVAASRNDNHGGDMLKRMRIFVKGLIHQCNKFKAHCELIMVEWNPPTDRPPLKDVLPGVSEDDFLEIRYIIVPNEIHKNHAFCEQIPLFQMIAKNVGIRRAKAQFVLCTNVDLLFSDELFKKLAKHDLQEGHYYRANRCDVPDKIEESWTVDQQIEFCKRNIVERLGKNPLYPNFASTNNVIFSKEWAIPYLNFLSKTKALYATSLPDKLNELDFNACGDFTLMSKNDWIRIQGYPELEIYSIHIDSMGVFAAAALGIKQVILDPWACSFHMQHTGGWEFKSPMEKIHFYTKRPMLDWTTVRDAGLHILKNKTTFDLNKEDWGLRDVALEEVSKT